MASDFLQFQTKMLKAYLSETLALCLPCLDPKPDIGCSANCSVFYEDFLYGKGFVDQKLANCLNNCEKSAKNPKKCEENCYDAAAADLKSLDQLLKRSL